MDFSGQYLTYAEYKALDSGSTLEQMPFNLLEYEARKQIDLRTFNRLVGGENIPQEVKLCEYRLINELDGYVKAINSVASNGNVASENTDGYSISYTSLGQIDEIVKSKNAELNDIIRTYLANTIYNDERLMYVGVK